jgi:quaternary ammonium compound-resistance protein SugE
MAWVCLIIAGLLEVVWATAMKQSHGFARLWPSIITLVGMLGSFGLLAFAMRSLPLGTSYTIWTGVGAIGAFIIGIVMLGEEASLPRIGAAALIVAGLIAMRLTSSH